jgi:hypothetical protein
MIMKLSDIKAGDIVNVEGLTCMPAGRHTVQSDDKGLFIPCSSGKHYLDGQEDEETGEMVGVEGACRVTTVSRPNQA